MLPNVRSTDLNHPTEPGEYDFTHGSVVVLQRHLDTWLADPDASFRTILLTRAGDRQLRFALGEISGE